MTIGDVSSREEYAIMRAEGHSIRYTADTVGISTTTAVKWEAEAREHIAAMREAELMDVYDRYGMTRVAQIRRVGEELRAVERVLAMRRGCLPGDRLVLSEEVTETDPTDVTRRVRRKVEMGGYNGVPTDRLLDLKMQLMDRLQRLHVPIRDEAPATEYTPENLAWAIAEHLQRVRDGEVTGEQARLEADALDRLVRVMELQQAGGGGTNAARIGGDGPETPPVPDMG